MLVQQVQRTCTETGGSCRRVLTAAGLCRATYYRWTGRLHRQEPLVLTPGPKKDAPLNLEVLQAEVRLMRHRRQRSFGTTALYQEHRREISRRHLQGRVREERRRVHAERRASLKRITWHVPGMAGAMDGTEIGSDQLLNMQDLASRYKFDPFLAASLSGKQVAEQLERTIVAHGEPLFLKRDHGGNLRHPDVQAVLEKYLILPLDSPCRYPMYNGAIEHAQREFKEVLEVRYPGAERALACHAAIAQELNHRRRPCLGGRTPCAVLQAGREAMKQYTRPKRKEIIEWIRTEALATLPRGEPASIRAQDAAWRRAIESWLHLNGAITVKVNGQVLPYSPKKRSH
jgi:transposase